MGKLFWILMMPLFFGGGDCKRKEQLNVVSDEDEMCPKGITSWLGSVANFMEKPLENIFATGNNEDVEAIFLSFTRRNEQQPYYVTNANFTLWDLEDNVFDPTIQTVFIIHGYKDGKAPWTKKLKDALLFREDCNVFIVENGTPSGTYTDASKKLPETGKQVAVFIRKLMKSKELDLEKVHLIGHSAGAHVAGFAGKEINRTQKRSVSRITGLDPAGVGFYDAAPDQRLDRTDASFVDVIHTNWGCSVLEGFGYPGDIGHFDFYPNGGQSQPGCLTLSEILSHMNSTVNKLMFNYLFGSLEQSGQLALFKMLCSHPRAHVFFTASILAEGCDFLSVQCSSWNHFLSGQCGGNDKVSMGYYADRYKDFAEYGIHKKFYIETTADPPSCI